MKLQSHPSFFFLCNLSNISSLFIFEPKTELRADSKSFSVCQGLICRARFTPLALTKHMLLFQETEFSSWLVCCQLYLLVRILNWMLFLKAPWPKWDGLLLGFVGFFVICFVLFLNKAETPEYEGELMGKGTMLNLPRKPLKHYVQKLWLFQNSFSKQRTVALLMNKQAFYTCFSSLKVLWYVS